MSTPVELGSRRQAWFAAMSDPDTHFAYPARDDVTTLRAAPGGRVFRLGDPVDLGPDSAWSQVSWEGGNAQDIWDDDQMFKDGSADTSTKQGKMRLHPGFKLVGISYDSSRKNATHIIERGQSDSSGGRTAVPNYIYIGDSTFRDGSGSGNRSLARYNPQTGAMTILKNDFATDITALHCTKADTLGEGWLIIGQAASSSISGLASGAIWLYHPTYAPAVELEDIFLEYAGAYPPTLGAAVQVGVRPNGITSYGDCFYYLFDDALVKRSIVSFGQVSHAIVKYHKSADWCQGITVWNNRIWYGTVFGSTRSTINVSDGVTSTAAFDIPEDFEVIDLMPHYGALYVMGRKQHPGVTGAYIGQIWRYNGATLVKLYEEGQDDDVAGHDYGFGWKMASWGPYLVWGRSSWDDDTVGLTYYDAEKDAILRGPTLTKPAGSTAMYTTNILNYGNGLAVDLRDNTTYSGHPYPNVLCLVQPNSFSDDFSGSSAILGSDSFNAQPSTKTKYVLSSEYDGGIPAEQKVWLTGRARVRVPASYGEIDIAVLLDGNATEYTVATIEYDAAAPDWRDVTFSIKDGGEYLKSTILQYKVYLKNTTNGTATTDTVEVDSVAIKFRPLPSRRRQWTVRLICRDNDELLDGTENAVTTADEMADTIEDLWAAQVPVYFWEPSADATEPSGSTDAVEVTISDFAETSFVVDDSGDSQVMREVALTLIEVA